jgi:hypothetical protein
MVLSHGMTHRLFFLGQSILLLMPLIWPQAVSAAEPKVEVVLSGLAFPTGVAVQPESGSIYVAESGRGRVVRVLEGQLQEAIVSFPTAATAENERLPTLGSRGPLGLAFLSVRGLVVGGGGGPLGEDALWVFELPETATEPLEASAAPARFSLPAAETELGEGDFYGLAVSSDTIFATCRGDAKKGWVGRLERDDTGKLTTMKRWLATTEQTQVQAPLAATLNPRGLLVIGNAGTFDQPHDARVSFYRPDEPRLLLQLATGLFDITGLAYGADGQLYATDFAHLDPAAGGLFRLIATLVEGRQTCRAERIVTLDRPTALAQGKDGAWYVTVFGPTAVNDGQATGKLLRIVTDH